MESILSLGRGRAAAPSLTQEQKLNRDVQVVSRYLVTMTFLGLVFAAVDQWKAKPHAAILWGLACLGVGSLIGFLFGIPRVLQGSGATSADEAQPAANHARLGVNTNLEQISDWLTKIFVGLGLVQLQKLPEHLNRAATFISSGLAPDSEFFAGALLIYFAVLGFLGFYLLTRLYFAGAFARADSASGGFSSEDVAAVQSVPPPIAGEQSTLTDEQQQAAQKIASQPMEQIANTKDQKVWASTQLKLGRYMDAINAYEKLIAQSPNDIMLRLEFSAALFESGRRERAISEALQAYRRITSNTPNDIKEYVYKTLIFLFLYQANGFEQAIKFGEEYVQKNENKPSGAIWVNLACAYGQRMTALLRDESASPELKADSRLKALDAMKRAIEIDSRWKEKLRELLRTDYPNKDPRENDLEVFENDPEFRAVLDLPAV
jgi:tetratricopeptide (TPR) repeat protein